MERPTEREGGASTRPRRWILPILVGLIAAAALFRLLPEEPERRPAITAARKKPPAEQISEMIALLEGDPAASIMGQPILAPAEVVRFYRGRDLRPAWTLPTLSGEAEKLVSAIRESASHGLRPDDYHLKMVDLLLPRLYPGGANRPPSGTSHIVPLDLLLTDAFLSLLYHHRFGRIDNKFLKPAEIGARPELDPAALLAAALPAGEVEKVLVDSIPQGKTYLALREALARYDGIVTSGGFPPLEGEGILKRGDRGGEIAALRRHLRLTGDLPPSVGEEETLFDAIVESGVRSFQERHRITPEGVVTPKTRAALNITAEAQRGKIVANMERLRWIPRDLGTRHILVDIARFELKVVEYGKSVLTMDAIVGRSYRQTPVFSSAVASIVLAPYWNVTKGIAVFDKLPHILKDPDYLEKNGYTVFALEEGGEREIAPEEVPWETLSKENFPYRLRQEPGPKNALGRVKFLLPNPFNVYLHDTPDTALFEEDVKTFSSGCIRLSRPIELALYLLKGDETWTEERLLEAIERWEEERIDLSEPLPIHFVYFTVRPGRKGKAPLFDPDIYNRDRQLLEAMGHLHP